MRGWAIPPPTDPIKTADDFQRERRAKVEELVRRGYLKSERIRQALLKVPREEFLPRLYRDHAYLEVPLPLPGKQATISCPHSYPLFYEPLGLDAGHSFLEVGLGSGYGTAVAREVVGDKGLVVAVEVDPATFEFASANLERMGYHDVVLVHGDGGTGHSALQPYDRISLTAACREIPTPLLEQLSPGGRLIGPVLSGHDTQELVLAEKTEGGIYQTGICEVLYVSLQGPYGA